MGDPADLTSAQRDLLGKVEQGDVDSDDPGNLVALLTLVRRGHLTMSRDGGGLRFTRVDESEPQPDPAPEPAGE